MHSFDNIPVLDEEKTGSLIKALGKDRYLELVSLVPPEVEKILERYNGSHGDNRSRPEPAKPDRRRDAHTLKGLAGNYGLSRLEHTARALEAENLTDAELDQLLGRLQTCIDEIGSLSKQ